MNQWQCQACGGVYTDLLPDGLRYFHVCPPLSRPELAAAEAAGRIAFPPGETVDDALSRRVYVRQSHRDENVVPSHDPTQPPTIKNAGRGRRWLPPASLPGPIVVPDV